MLTIFALPQAGFEEDDVWKCGHDQADCGQRAMSEKPSVVSIGFVFLENCKNRKAAPPQHAASIRFTRTIAASANVAALWHLAHHSTVRR
ncbi:hypothetical protein ACVWZR_006881 [Bradyrhizobium sp. i1.3.1]